MGRKPVDVPTEEEVRRMHDYLKKRVSVLERTMPKSREYKLALRDYALFMVLVSTGRRIGEILAVMVRDIRWDDNVMYTTIEKRREDARHLTRAQKAMLGLLEKRPITINDQVKAVLRKYIEVWGLKENQRLFELSDRRAEMLVGEWALAVGIRDKNIKPHSFRHFMVTQLKKRGWTFEEIAKVTGHKSIRTLEQIYDHTTFWDIASEFKQSQEDILRSIIE